MIKLLPPVAVASEPGLPQTQTSHQQRKQSTAPSIVPTGETTLTYQKPSRQPAYERHVLKVISTLCRIGAFGGIATLWLFGSSQFHITAFSHADDSAESQSGELPPLSEAREAGRLRSAVLANSKSDKEAITPVGPPKANLADFQKHVAPVFTKTCVLCHGPKTAEGDFRVDTLDPDLLKGADIDKWLEVFGALSNGEMPPEDESKYHLADEPRAKMIEWLGAEIQKASKLRRNEGEHSSFRRLTKYEYNYALQDLLGLPNNFVGNLPPESTSEDGFKNSSHLLQMSAMQFANYREIGLKALKKATVSGERPPAVTYVISMPEEMDNAKKKNAKTFNAADKDYRNHKNKPHLLDQKTGQGLYFSAGSIAPKPDAVAGQTLADSSVVWVVPRSTTLKYNMGNHLPDDGIMRVSLHVGRTTSNANEYLGLRLVFSAHTSNNANFTETISKRDIPVTATADKPQWIHFDIPLSEITRNPFRKSKVTFPRRDEMLTIQSIATGNLKKGEEPLSLHIGQIEISAPFYEQWPPQTHRDIFIASSNKNDEEKYGREVLTRFMVRALRRPATAQEIDSYMGLFAKYRPEFTNLEDAMLEVLATILATPEFLYLTQELPATDAKTPSAISDLELASRLSFFLWSSIPDDELLQLAQQGKLNEPTVLSAQVKRMLADDRSQRFSQNFVQQWLGMDGLNSVQVDNKFFKNAYDSSLKAAMEEEPIALFNEVLTQNESVMDFIHADYAMVNERLAKHYRIPEVYGPHFRRVPIEPQTNRGGILTGAGVLTMNSDGKDSHPLKRGVWLLERILHDPPPPPPPNVPEVDLTNPEILKMSLKERIADHRNKAACMSCHAKIDPWGIAFENYDALGVYRTQIANKPVDATSALFNKQELAGIEGLKRYILSERQDQFARAMVHKMTSYALGRPMSFSDRADIDNMTAQFRKRGDRLGDLVELIVSSDMFHTR